MLFVREAKEDHFLKDVLVKKGSCVQANLLAAMFNPKYFPDPIEFKPERWTD